MRHVAPLRDQNSYLHVRVHVRMDVRTYACTQQNL